MPITKYLLTYIATFGAFIVIDLIWLGFVARDFYRKQLGSLMTDQINWTAAIIFYLLYIVAILVFAVLPAVQAGSVVKAITLGAFFGFIAYATYDLTNLATLNNWPVVMTIVDIIWGAVLTGLVATAGYYAAMYFKV